MYTCRNRNNEKEKDVNEYGVAIALQYFCGFNLNSILGSSCLAREEPNLILLGSSFYMYSTIPEEIHSLLAMSLLREWEKELRA
jgi:hypothetical protein